MTSVESDIPTSHSRGILDCEPSFTSSSMIILCEDDKGSGSKMSRLDSQVSMWEYIADAYRTAQISQDQLISFSFGWLGV